MRARHVIACAACAGAAAWSACANAAGAPPTRYPLPAGVLKLSDSSVPAGSGARITFAVALDRAVRAGTLTLTLPRIWIARSPISGLAYTKLDRARRAAGGRARVSRSGRVVSFVFSRARKGDAATFGVTDSGLPAAAYRLPYSWREGATVSARGTARVDVSARPRMR